MKDFWEDNNIQDRRINKKKIIKISILLIISLLIIIVVAVYNLNDQASNWIDKYILKKEVLQEEVNSIEISNILVDNVYTYNNNIGILNKNKFDIYNSSGEIQKTLEIQISNPIFYSTNRFLTIAEKEGKKLYVIENNDISWEKSVEGNINQVFINDNGYVGVIITDTSYKTVITVYDPNGKALFNNYLSSTKIIDLDISEDNKYLALAEIDTSGTTVQSIINILSIEKAATDPTQAVEKIYKSSIGKLIVDIEYKNKNIISVMYSDMITMIKNEKEQVIIDSEEKKISYQAIELDENIVYVEEKSSGLFSADSYINILELDEEPIKQTEYIINDVVKTLVAKDNVIAINLGTEIEFINNKGWLIKRYVSTEEINDISISNNLAAIIYTDRVEIIKL